MEYKVGDTVIIHKPADICQIPGWVPEMDKYDGRTAVIAYVEEIASQNLTVVTIKGDCGIWIFNTLWLEPYDDEEFSTEDIWNLM